MTKNKTLSGVPYNYYLYQDGLNHSHPPNVPSKSVTFSVFHPSIFPTVSSFLHNQNVFHMVVTFDVSQLLQSNSDKITNNKNAKKKSAQIWRHSLYKT